MSHSTDSKHTGQKLGTLVVRADASPKVGVGHVMRCLALAQEWIRQRGSVRFVCRELPNALRQRLTEESIEVTSIESQRVADADDVKATLRACSHAMPELVVLDGYSFDDAYEEAIRSGLQASCRLLAFDDDQHATHEHADFILNQNFGAGRDVYGERRGLLVGSDYTLLRREFLEAGPNMAGPNMAGEKSEHAGNILVTLGGADPHNTTSLVLKALCQIEDPRLAVRVLAGVANPHLDNIEEIAKSDGRVQVIVSTNDMLAFYRWADIAISAGGSTNWEMCYFGIPRCSVVLAENQRPVLEELEKIGATKSLGWYADLDVEQVSRSVAELLSDVAGRRTMRQVNQTCIDGKGVQRIIDAVRATHAATRHHSASPPSLDKTTIATDGVLTLRPAEFSDAELLLSWRNHPETRKWCRQTEVIELPEHLRWFKRTLHDPLVMIFIATIDEQPVGTIRADFEGVEDDGSAARMCELSWTVAVAARGKGVAGRMACLLADRISETLVAFVQEGNEPSVRIAEKAGLRFFAADDKMLEYRRHSQSTLAKE